MHSPITTHVLDTSRGSPAAGIAITLAKQTGAANDAEWHTLSTAVTDADGRVGNFFAENPSAMDRFEAGTYRLLFAVGDYLSGANSPSGESPFYSDIPIIFAVHSTDEHYHVPLLLNPFGYSTYRGS